MFAKHNIQIHFIPEHKMIVKLITKSEIETDDCNIGLKILIVNYVVRLSILSWLNNNQGLIPSLKNSIKLQVVLAILIFMLCVECSCHKITSSIKLRLRESIQLHYGHDLRGNSYNRLVTDAWDSMQRKLECCGSDGNASAVYSWAIYKGHSEWYHNRRTSSKFLDNLPSVFSFLQGCYEKVKGHLVQHAFILGAVALSVPLLLNMNERMNI
ncbi:hypothetical protein KUTeg_016891 [Tegillarca granosa]|uniref:Uncharacterized protein n=1 Tax=Tegillarca granosa TaxID=220873 RepID=A0ABQ9EPS1_TEGGR|nr:hypothetical protein KUTeg_016891 [Tegillarca granosa]